MKPLLLLLASLLVVTCLFAACSAPPAASAGDTADCSNLPSNGAKIKIESPWAKATSDGTAANATTPAMGSGNQMSGGSIKTAAFMVIHNCGAQADTLVGARSNLDGMTRLMSFELKGGKSTMTDVSQIELPAGKKVELKSGGYHVMFMGLKNDLKPGDPVELTLNFKLAGEIKVNPVVKAP